MAMSVWTRKDDLIAFEHGQEAARQGAARVPQRTYATYNERAAFNDGWDTVSKKRRGTPVKRPPKFSLPESHDPSAT